MALTCSPPRLLRTLSGSNIVVQDAVTNQGRAPAGPFTISYCLSSNAVYDAGTDVLLCSRNVSGLAVTESDEGNSDLVTASVLVRGKQK